MHPTPLTGALFLAWVGVAPMVGVACTHGPPAPAAAPVAAAEPMPAPAPRVARPSTPAKPERAFVHCTKGPEPKPPFASLRAVDWCNFTVRVGFGTMHGGRSEMHEYEELGGPHDTMLARLGAVSYGDLDGDGIEEAAVVLDEEDWFTSGAHHERSTVYVFTLTNGIPVRRSSHPVRYASDARIEHGKLLLDP